MEETLNIYGELGGEEIYIAQSNKGFNFTSFQDGIYASITVDLSDKSSLELAQFLLRRLALKTDNKDLMQSIENSTVLKQLQSYYSGE